MDECALRITSACTKQDGIGAGSISSILTMVSELCVTLLHGKLQIHNKCYMLQSLDKLKRDGLPLAALNVMEGYISAFDSAYVSLVNTPVGHVNIVQTSWSTFTALIFHQGHFADIC